ncbi:uncharacterized protein AKAW2_80282A [Aspergillus luchuensis]|uniref:Uncharacterized protein n=2 Tax=Aspergillus kawachii TaxID=1069201 RepID=A0A7R8A3N7_ASPKA|nr:uncharacterized protein AKAW2_80282A [Aspergillus luchuensis]BCS04481.1 hypothetical protein AKAW2_80282A [Aspergillus luchuensis]
MRVRHSATTENVKMGKHAPDKEFQSQAQTSVVLPPAGNDGRTRTPQIASPPKEARPDQPSTTPVSIGQTRSASLDHYWVLNGERRRSKPTVREGHVDPGSGGREAPPDTKDA